MPAMIVKVRVTDTEKWKPVFDELEKVRRDHGITGHEIYRDATDPNVVIVVSHTQDLSRAREFGGSEALRSAMERAGVEGPPEIWFVTDEEAKQY